MIKAKTLKRKSQIYKNFKNLPFMNPFWKMIQICIPTTRTMTQNQELKTGKVRVRKNKMEHWDQFIKLSTN